MKIALGLEKDNGLVQIAISLGVHAFDTAAAYGTEGALKGVPEYCKIVTKISKGHDPIESINHSLKNIKKIHAALMHHAGDYSPENVFKLDSLKTNKQISKYGLSVYDPEDVPGLPFDVIQFPLSLLDQRFLPQINGWKTRGIELWARSCFLRGVLLADPRALPPYFDPIQRRLGLLPKNPVARLSILLNFVYNAGVDYCILGFKDQKELTLALDCLPGLTNNEFSTADCIDPRGWVRG